MLSKPLYTTNKGKAYCGDASNLMRELQDESVDLVITSPPFALQRQKAYGNEDQSTYVAWLLSFTPEIKRILKPTGSFVLDLGGAYQRGLPIRSIYQYRVLVKMCDELGWHLAEEFFWYNPAKLPSPIEWVNKRKIRAKDSVNTIWWFSKSTSPKANISNVLTPYSDRMAKLLSNKTKYYEPALRPSGHDIGEGFNKDNGGAIPSNLLQIPNTESNSPYLRLCKLVGATRHPARFPSKLPEFFIKFLTDEGDTVLDIFAGSNTTGAAAEELNRHWLAFDLDQDYLATSALRFVEEYEAKAIYNKLSTQGTEEVDITSQVLEVSLERPTLFSSIAAQEH
jgi:site-specific DNA-methyltransferase (cytosine-N4-specific)